MPRRTISKYGRPLLKPHLQRKNNLTVRFNNVELRSLERYVKAHDGHTRGSFIREAVMEKIKEWEDAKKK